MEIRAVTENELPELARVVEAVAFGMHGHPDVGLAAARSLLELDRTRAAFEDGRLVGGSAALSWELTLPGQSTIAAAAVTWVGVLPTHRRRGLLTAMMQALLDDARDRGEPVAVLLASESVIYGRFGYGCAVTNTAVEIDRARAALARPVDDAGRFRLVDDDEAGVLLPRLFDDYRRTQPGEVSRSAGWWETHFDDPEHNRDGATAFFHVVHESPSGEADGYAAYRLGAGATATDPLAGVELTIWDLVAPDPAVRLALWQYCLNVDLVSTVRALACPVEEPLRWMLRDPRRLRVTRQSDWLWVRLLDVATALAARRYAVEDRLVFDVAGERYELVGGADGAECKPTDAVPDLTMAFADMGAAFLGGVRFSTLAHAGRVVERTPGALARADTLFASDPPPFCTTEF